MCELVITGVLLPAFKAKTMDFTPIPRKSQIQILRTDPLYRPLSQPNKTKEENASFTVDASFDTLEEIMKSQSSGRKQVISHG